MQTLELEYDDSRITWGLSPSQWSQTEMTDADGATVSVRASTSRVGRVMVFFRGTGIKFYAGGEGRIWTSFDGDSLESTESPIRPGSAPLLERTGLADADHQLFLLANGPCWVDRIELESETGQGFDPINYTVDAASVPQQALLVEDFSGRIELEPPENWEYVTDEIYSGGSLLRTNRSGSSLTYQFEGVGIWMFADWDQYHGERVITLDDGPEEIISTKLDSGQTMQRLTWSKTGLAENVNHTLRMEYRGPEPAYITLDFFRVLQSQDRDALTEPSASSTDLLSRGSSSGDAATASIPVGSSPPSESSKGLSAAVLGPAIGVPIAFIALGIAVVLFVMRRRKNRRTHPANIIDPLPYSTSQTNTYRIYAPPPGPPPQKDNEEHYQAERPSIEGPSPKPFLTVETGIRSPVHSAQIFSPVEGSISTEPSSERALLEPERPRRKL